MNPQPDIANVFDQLLDALADRMAPAIAARVAAEVTEHLNPNARNRPDDIFTLQEVAATLRCTIRTVSRRISMGDLVAYKDGGRVLVLRRDLEAFRVRWWRR